MFDSIIEQPDFSFWSKIVLRALLFANMEKFANKYRIPSTRKRDHDYGGQGTYFITICTDGFKSYFGHFDEDGLILNRLGQQTHQEWRKTEEIRKDMNITLHAFVVMPNHFHALFTIGANPYNTNRDAMHCVSTNEENQTYARDAMLCVSTNDENQTNARDAMHCVSTNDENQTNARDAMHCVSTCANTFGPQRKNVASVIRGFKMAVSTFARKNHIEFAWQPLFHDRIVRDDRAFHAITRYIENNPRQWQLKHPLKQKPRP